MLMLYSGINPESYITAHTSVHEENTLVPFDWFDLNTQRSGSQKGSYIRLIEFPIAQLFARD